MIQSQGARRAIRNVSWLFVERVLRLGLVLLTGIAMARAMGDELFGQLNYATGFVGLFYALGAAGIDDILMRELVRRPHQRDELLGSAALLKLAGSGLMVLLALIGTVVKGMDGLTATLVVVIAGAELLRPFGVVEHWFMSREQAGPAARVQLAQAIISAAAKLLLAWLVHVGHVSGHAGLIGFAWMYVLESLVLAIGYTYAFKHAGGHWRQWRATGALVMELLRESWPMLIYGMALYVQARIDQVMIKDLLTASKGEEAAFAEVGQYSVALRMAEALGFLPVIFSRALAPAITKAKAASHELYMDRLLNQYRLMFALFLATAVPLYLLAEPIVVILFGQEFEPAGALLALFAVRLFFTNIGTGKGSFIINESLFKYSLITAILGACVNIGVNWMLIPAYASKGAIWATIISFTAHIFLLDLFVPRMRENLRVMLKGIFTFWKLRRAA